MIRSSIAACAVVLALAGCGSGPSMAEPQSSAAPTTSSQVKVLAAFYPYWYVAQRVGGPGAVVELLTAPGVEPHDLELSPKQVEELGDVDLVIYQRGFQPALDAAVAQQVPGAQLEVNAALGRTPVADVHEDEHADEADHTDEQPTGDAEHADEAAHNDAEDEPGHAHSAPGDLAADPHVWMDPDKLSAIATATADALSRVNPAGSAGYQQRASELRADLVTLDNEFRSGLGTCARRAVVVNHAAFGHLTARYGLEQVPVNGITPEAAPSPQRLAELATQIRTEGATTVYTETLASPRLAETLANEAGVKTATLDPLEGLASGDSRDFLGVMRDNLNALRVGLDCTSPINSAPTSPAIPTVTTSPTGSPSPSLTP